MTDCISACPDTIPLPSGFQPEGVAIGHGATLYVGSFVSGAIYQADLHNAQGDVLAPGQQEGVAMGLAFDKRTGYLFVAGGRTGQARVYDTVTGAVVAIYELRTSGSLINDVILTTQAAYFTDYLQPVLHRVPLSEDGELSSSSNAVEIPLRGDFVFAPNAFNGNGLEVSPDERYLILVHSSRGELYRIDPNSGYAVRIALEHSDVRNGDGLLLDGSTLYVVQNVDNQIAVINLNDSYTSGQLIGYIRSPVFNIPTTIAGVDSFLYVCNFGSPGTPVSGYNIVRVPKLSRSSIRNTIVKHPEQ